MRRWIVSMVIVMAFAGCGGGGTAPVEDAADVSPAVEDGGGDGLADDADDSGGEEVAAVDDDRDGDGVSDATDNCPDAANADQEDVDGDAQGDACDGDIDGDGVANADDNCRYVANPAQDATDDDGDGVAAACDLDESDSRVGDGRGAVFVDIARGDDGAFGTREHPVATLARGIALAREANKDVYVAAGSYPTSGLAVYDGVDLFGGFMNDADPALRFSQRDVRTSDSAYRTALTRDDDDVTLFFEDAALVVDGFHIINEATAFDSVDGARTVVVGSGADVVLDRCTIAGNATAMRSTAVTVVAGGSLTLTRSRVEGGGADAPGAASVGLEVDASTATILNNIVQGGRARFAAGMVLRDAAPLVVNNTVDGSSGAEGLGTAEGVRLEDADPVFVNNLVFTDVAANQYPLSCFGDVGAAAEFRNNLFAAFPRDADYALVRDCDGVSYRGGIGGLSFAMGAAAVADNIYYAASDDVNDLVAADGDYHLVGGSLFDGVDDGADTSIESYGAVSDDFSFEARGGSYDIGAMEN